MRQAGALTGDRRRLSEHRFPHHGRQRDSLRRPYPDGHDNRIQPIARRSHPGVLHLYGRVRGRCRPPWGGYSSGASKSSRLGYCADTVMGWAALRGGRTRLAAGFFLGARADAPCAPPQLFDINAASPLSKENFRSREYPKIPTLRDKRATLRRYGNRVVEISTHARRVLSPASSPRAHFGARRNDARDSRTFGGGRASV